MPGLAPAADSLFFASPKKSKQKKGDPTVCVPALRSGQPAVLGAGGVSLELAPAALRQSRALIRHPLRAAGATRKGGGAQQPHGPSLRSAWRASARRLRPRRRAERSDGPCGLRVFNPLLAAPAAGCLRGGMRAPARMLRELTRRVCPNGAPQARSELCGEPRKRPAPGLPRSEAQGSQTEGRLSFAYFSLAKQRKVSRPPGRDPAPALRKSTE